MDRNSSPNPPTKTSSNESDELASPSQINQPSKPTQSPLNNAVKAGGARSALLNIRNNTNNAPRNTVSHANFEDNSVMVKYTITWINRVENNKIYEIIIEFPQMIKVNEAIRDMIPYFNDKLGQENSDYTLSEDPNLYELKKAKKNGFPKEDYPDLDSTQVLSQTNILKLNLKEKENDAIINKNGSFKSGTITPTKNDRSSMVDQRMPVYNFASQAESYSERTTVVTCCWCIKIKKKSKVAVDAQRENDLDSQLLEKDHI